MTMQCVVLAGGKGTRLQGMFGNTPKLLVPVLDESFADLQLARLIDCGFTRLTYAIGHESAQIRRHFACHPETRVQIEFLADGETPRGTGGAIRHLYDMNMLDDAFAITYGDTLLDVDPLRLFQRLAADDQSFAVLSVWKNDNFLVPSNVDFDGHHVVSYIKDPDAHMGYRYVDYGMMVARKSIIPEYLPSGKFSDLGRLVSQLAESHTLLGHEVFNRFYEIGTPAGLADTERYLKHVRTMNEEDLL